MQYSTAKIDKARTQYMTKTMMSTIERYYNQHKNEVKIQNVVSGIAMLIVPFMTNILSKYSESDFHRAMSQTYKDEEGRMCRGFDFITDWRVNHAGSYNIMVPAARFMRNTLNFNVDIASSLICDIIASWGWHLSVMERISIRHLLYRIKRLIYS